MTAPGFPPLNISDPPSFAGGSGISIPQYDDNFTRPRRAYGGALETEGGPLYKELVRILRGGFEARRAGKNADAFVRSQTGEGSDIQSMKDVADAIARGLPDEEYPMTAGEHAMGGELEAGNRLGLGVPAKTWPEAVRAHLRQFETNEPGEARAAAAVGSYPTYAAATASGNPWVAAGGAGLATGIDAYTSLPDSMPMNWKKTAAVLGPAALSAFLTRGTAAGLHGFAGKFHPEAEGAEQLLELSGGEKALEKELERLRAQTPGLEPVFAELNPRLGKVATRGIPLTAPEIQQDLINAAHDAWLQARTAKLSVGARYAALNAVVDDPRIAAVLNKPSLEPVLSRLLDSENLTQGQLHAISGTATLDNPGEAMTGRALNDVRLELESNIKRVGRQLNKDPQRPDLVSAIRDQRAAARTIRQVLVDKVAGFEQLQSEYGPYAQREATRREMFRRLAGVDPSPAGPPQGGLPPGRGTGLPKPPETTVRGQLEYHTRFGGVRGTKEQQTIAQARNLAPLMFAPAADALKTVKSGALWPWYAGETSLRAALVRALPGAATGGVSSYGLPRLFRNEQPEQ